MHSYALTNTDANVVMSIWLDALCLRSGIYPFSSLFSELEVVDHIGCSKLRLNIEEYLRAYATSAEVCCRPVHLVALKASPLLDHETFSSWVESERWPPSSRLRIRFPAEKAKSAVSRVVIATLWLKRKSANQQRHFYASLLFGSLCTYYKFTYPSKARG